MFRAKIIFFLICSLSSGVFQGKEPPKSHHRKWKLHLPKISRRTIVVVGIGIFIVAYSLFFYFKFNWDEEDPHLPSNPASECQTLEEPPSTESINPAGGVNNPIKKQKDILESRKKVIFSLKKRGEEKEKREKEIEKKAQELKELRFLQKENNPMVIIGGEDFVGKSTLAIRLLGGGLKILKTIKKREHREIERILVSADSEKPVNASISPVIAQGYEPGENFKLYQKGGKEQDYCEISTKKTRHKDYKGVKRELINRRIPAILFVANSTFDSHSLAIWASDIRNFLFPLIRREKKALQNILFVINVRLQKNSQEISKEMLEVEFQKGIKEGFARILRVEDGMKEVFFDDTFGSKILFFYPTDKDDGVEKIKERINQIPKENWIPGDQLSFKHYN